MNRKGLRHLTAKELGASFDDPDHCWCYTCKHRAEETCWTEQCKCCLTTKSLNTETMPSIRDQIMKAPKWLTSLEAQREFLALKGLRTSSPNASGWTTLERIPVESDEPTLIDGIDVRGDRRHFDDEVNYVKARDPSPDKDIVTERETQAYLIHIDQAINAETQNRVFGIVTKKVLK